MEWKNKLLDKCNALRIEMAEDKEKNNKLIFICPKMPEEKTKIELIDLLPKELPYDFVEGIKQSTLIKLKAVTMNFGIYSANVTGSKNMSFIVNSAQSEEVKEKIFEAVDGIFRDDGFFEGWKIKINNEERFYFPTVDIGAKRDTRIRKDDILNIKIALNTTTSVEEFMGMI